MDDLILFYVGAGLISFCLILILINFIRISKMSKKYKMLIKGLSDKDVEDLMISYSEEMHNIKNDIEDNIKKRIVNLEEKMPACYRNLGMVTYNAFDNVSNNMSFSIIALNDEKDGVVLTGIYTRESSYVYTKEIKRGIPSRELSKEEKEAYDMARG